MRLATPLVIALVAALAAGPAGAAPPFGVDPRPEVAVRAFAEGRSELIRARQALETEVPVRAFQHATRALAAFEAGLVVWPDPDAAYSAFVATTLLPDGRDRWLATVRAGERLRRLAPLDPRDTVPVTVAMASAYTSLGGLGGADAPRYFALAIEEQRRLRARLDSADPQDADNAATSTCNGAELLMAQGPEFIDEALEAYELAIRLYPNDALHHYGAALAADRAGQTRKADEHIRDAVTREVKAAPGAAVGDCGLNRLVADGVFFLPVGEIEAYFALGCEAVQQPDRAILHWQRFIQAVPDSPYLAHAKRRLAALEAKPAQPPKGRPAAAPRRGERDGR